MYRVAQEALNNVTKHARARYVSVHLKRTEGCVVMTITDDGRGFAIDQDSPTGHFGLLDMRERAASMGSRLKVESDPGHGACLSVEVPLHPKEVIDEELKANTYSGR